MARHADDEHLVASWRRSEDDSGSVTGEPVSDWQVAQLVRLSEALGGRLVGEDGEFYRLRDGVVEQVSGSHVYEFGKIERDPRGRPGPVERVTACGTRRRSTSSGCSRWSSASRPAG